MVEGRTYPHGFPIVWVVYRLTFVTIVEEPATGKMLQEDWSFGISAYK